MDDEPAESAAMPTVDAVDQRILEVLRDDGRASMAQVAAACRISRANAYARVARMEADGVIRGFTVRTDPVSAGRHASAYVTLTIEQNSWKSVRDRLAAIREVEHIALIGGDADVMLLVRARDNAHLRRVVLGEIQAIPEVRGSRTTLIFEDFDLR